MFPVYSPTQFYTLAIVHTGSATEQLLSERRSVSLLGYRFNKCVRRFRRDFWGPKKQEPDRVLEMGLGSMNAKGCKLFSAKRSLSLL